MTDLARSDTARPALARMPLFRIFTGVVVATILALIIYPLARLFERAFSSNEGFLGAFGYVLSRSWLPDVLLDTIILVVVSSVLAILVASLFAWINERTDASLGWFGDIVPLLPLVTPQITVVIGWVFLASPRVGFVTSRLEAIGINFPLYSWTGMIFLYTLALMPFGYIIISASLRNLDSSLEEAARISGASLITMIRKVSLPAVLPSIGAGTLLVMIQALSFYAIPAIIAPNTQIGVLSVRIISVVRNYPPDIASAAVLSLFLASMIIPLWLAQRHLVSLGQSAKIGGRAAGTNRIRLGRWRWFARGAVIFYLVLSSLLPFLALLIVAMQPFWRPQIDFSLLSLSNFYEVAVVNPLTTNALKNSVIIGATAGLVTMGTAFTLALFIRASNSRIGLVVDGIAKIPILLPHVAFGIAFMISLGMAPFYLTGTLLILIIANTVMFIPQASIAADSALGQIGSDLEEAAQVSGATRGRIAWKILLPLMFPGLVGGWSLVFVLAAAELAASQLLSTGATPVIGAVIYDLYAGGSNFGGLAALSVIVTLLSSLVIGLAAGLVRFTARGRRMS